MKKIVFFLLITISSYAQKESLRSEILLGRTIPSYQLFTGKNPQIVIGLSYEYKNDKPSDEWQSILNYPTTGVSLYYTNYGTKTKGNSLSIIPFIEFHPFNNYKWSLKLGMGTSYFDTKYHPINNPENEFISSDFTWAIQGVLYYDMVLKNTFDLRLGLGYFHHSNGHTKLPNLGLNAALLSVSKVFELKKKTSIDTQKPFDKTTVKKYSSLFYSIRFGTGIQAFVTEDSSLKNVYTLAISGGTYYKNIVKLKFGASYRFYQHYYDHINENELVGFIEDPFLNASNLYVSLGAEVLVGRIGIDWETGVNIYKPFFKTHYDLQKTKSESQYQIKKLIIGRLGLKLYVINMAKKPKNNFYLSAHINSNFGQADFSELSIGFTHRINTKNK